MEAMKGHIMQQAVDALKAGDAVVFPTDTVYGLGVAVGPCASPAELFRIKQRDEGKPVAWLVGSVDDMRVYGLDVSEQAIDLAEKHWPGALTLIVKASGKVPVAFQSATGTIGLRMPNSETALTLIRGVGVPVATTSANISGAPAPSCDAELDEAVLSRAAAVVRGEDCLGGCASTVVDCTKETLVVLRQGSITLD